MNNNYKELNIQKSLYRGCGESFAERLEKMDPTENYRGTELGHLDAFQRQLKRFDIQVGGSHSSALEKFFQNGQSAVLFPEYLMRAIRQGMEENDPLSSIVAARTLISATDYRGLTTNDDLEADVTNEAAALSTTTISLKDKTTALKKRGRMLRASYEAIKFQRLDLFTLALRRIGAEIARCQMKDAVDVLVNGDGSTGSAPAKLTTAATTLAYSDLLTLWSNFTAYQMNTLLVNAKTAAAILGLSAFSDPTTGLHFQNTGKLGTPLGAEMILCDAVADGTIIALDRHYALEMVVGDAVTVDADRLIDCQLERAAVSSTAGFSMIFPDMDIELILQKFAVFSGLTGEELQACLPYCRDAMEQLTAKRRSALPAAEPLGSAAAALAYYRWCLAQMSGSSLPHVGAAALVNKDTLAAAKALCEEYLAAAAGELGGGKFYFGQVTACK